MDGRQSIPFVLKAFAGVYMPAACMLHAAWLLLHEMRQLLTFSTFNKIITRYAQCKLHNTYLNRFPKRDEERRHAEVVGGAVVAERVIVVLAAAGSPPAVFATAVPTSSRKGGHRGKRKKSPEGHRCELTRACHRQVQHRSSGRC